MKKINVNSHFEINRIVVSRFLFYTILFVITLFSTQTLLSLNKFNRVEATTSVTMFRIKMRGLPNYLDECVFYYQQGATDGFDSSYDAYKLFGFNPAPHISIDNDSLLMVINGISPVSQTYSTNILATTPITQTFTISAEDIQDLPPGTCVLLKDLQTNTVVNLLVNSYVFILSSNTTTSRFVLTITYNTLPITSNVTQPTCQLPNNGKSIVTPSSGAPWDYVWKNAQDSIIKTSTGVFSADSLENIINGDYRVEVKSTNDACLRNEFSFTVNEVITPFVSFTTSDSVMCILGNIVSPVNSSSNCSNYFWDFGDGLGNSCFSEPVYSYSACGNYQVKLVGTSASGCIDSATKSIKIIGLTTSLTNNSITKSQLKDMGNNQFQLNTQQSLGTNIQVNVTALDGKNCYKKLEKISDLENINFDFSNLNVGLYVLNLISDNGAEYSTKMTIK